MISTNIGMQFAGDRTDADSASRILNRRKGITVQTASWVKYNILAVVLSAGLAASAGATMPDAWITTKTKLAMLTTEGVSGTQINVDTIIWVSGRRISLAIRRTPGTLLATSTARR
jgi:hypothetical protein